MRKSLAAALLGIAAVAAMPHLAQAQPADLPIPPATTAQYPPNVTIRQIGDGANYVDARGLVLYGMDMRTVLRWSPDAAMYCQGDCQAKWEPLLAPADAAVNIRFPAGGGARPDPAANFIDNRKAPDWTVIKGPQGPQWVYKGWHMVFTRRGSAPGSTDLDGSDDGTWNTLKFVPPVPDVIAPPGVTAAFAGGRYVLVDARGHRLFTGTCTGECGWTIMAAPMAGAGLGKWTVDRSGTVAQWLFASAPVYVAGEDDPETVPAGGKAIEP